MDQRGESDEGHRTTSGSDDDPHDTVGGALAEQGETDRGGDDGVKDGQGRQRTVEATVTISQLEESKAHERQPERGGAADDPNANRCSRAGECVDGQVN